MLRRKKTSVLVPPVSTRVALCLHAALALLWLVVVGYVLVMLTSGNLVAGLLCLFSVAWVSMLWFQIGRLHVRSVRFWRQHPGWRQVLTQFRSEVTALPGPFLIHPVTGSVIGHDAVRRSLLGPRVPDWVVKVRPLSYTTHTVEVMTDDDLRALTAGGTAGAEISVPVRRYVFRTPVLHLGWEPMVAVTSEVVSVRVRPDGSVYQVSAPAPADPQLDREFTRSTAVLCAEEPDLRAALAELHGARAQDLDE